jgi:hypothetical protein
MEADGFENIIYLHSIVFKELNVRDAGITGLKSEFNYLRGNVLHQSTLYNDSGEEREN